MTKSRISWVTVEPGSILVGSNNRSILFGGMGPRHEVIIDYKFQISQRPLLAKEAARLIDNKEVETASESEWQLAYSRSLISGVDGSSESLADSAQDFWGKTCDGRPFVKSSKSPKIIRRWKSGQAKPLAVFTQGSPAEPVSDGVRVVIRESTDWSSKTLAIPEKRNNSRVIMEEILICLVVGIIPSFVWATFNASPGYIREGWLNLVLGGIFFGLFTMLFWRPKQPTWYLESGRMTPKKRNK
ncbi:MAG: hypothetical protein L7R66_02565 [Candidatus Thalassarchaeaceae archaeon]|nr:hypothetical protein [Candidatus Thalassarchaeaceae archaeon]